MGRFIVIQCENSTAWKPYSFYDMFREGLQQAGDSWTVCELASGEALPDDILQYQGIVITGSRFNCRDRETLPWFDELCELIRKSAEEGSPRIYGGCFGCQIIGHALGGEVDYNPGQRFLLRAEKLMFNSCCKEACECSSELLPEDIKTKWCSAGFRLIVSHGDCVCKLPPQAKLLASSESCNSEVFIVGKNDNILACQSHPEFDYQYAVAERIWPTVVDTRKRLTDEEIEVAKASFEQYNKEDAKMFMQWISNFLHL